MSVAVLVGGYIRCLVDSSQRMELVCRRVPVKLAARIFEPTQLPVPSSGKFATLSGER